MAKTPSATHPNVTLTSEQWSTLLDALNTGTRFATITATQQGQDKKEIGDLLLKVAEIEEEIKKQLPQ